MSEYKPGILAMLFRRWGHLFSNYYFAIRCLIASRGRKIDVCMAHDTFALNAGNMVSCTSGSRFIYDAVEVPLIRERSGKYLAQNMSRLAISLINDYIEPRILRKVDKVIANSPGHARWLDQHYELKAPPALVFNARKYQEKTSSNDIRMAAGVSENDILVLYVGNANPSYGVEELIEALANLPSNVHIALLGYMPDEYAKSINDLLHSRQVQSRFHVIQPVAYEELTTYASGADIGVIALHREVLNMKLCLPNRFFDFVMARLPIASSRIPAIVEQMEKYGLGTFFDENQPSDIAEAITRLSVPAKMSEHREACDAASRELCWGEEEKKLLEILEDNSSSTERMSICIVARKNIWRTQRVIRIAESLAEAGHKVLVMSPLEPEHEISNSGVTYMTIDDGRRLIKKIAQQLRQVPGFRRPQDQLS